MSKKYVKLAASDIKGLGNIGLSSIIVEVSDTGVVNREVGIGVSGDILYIFPGKGRFGSYGLFDNVTFQFDELSNDMTSVDFDAVFDRGQQIL
ncbi:hypothetical protein MOK15_15470 [Sphingobium sp. BYY-5]|uniref:hypothetical protein n=1 Tax=Sphingobium sp. BYY-5 TaxID=2926400 RepID=UPI001FA79F11|nr:hypothetical protein [Sphingobium sp. BYY-5]MCI4591481.1 hypothetical protein [Sphingobium sp. BYY-5]